MVSILNRWTGAVIATGPTVREASEAAIVAKIDLTRANLCGANLTRANLGDANLGGADLTRADLTRANLGDANLGGADLTRANLGGANLGGANLCGADLTDADLGGANLTRANLGGAKEDLFSVLDAVPEEVPALLAALNEGRVDGSTYSGACACLVGTIANARNCDVDALPVGARPNSGRPAERWFLSIRPGCTPDRSPVAALTVEWVNQWQAKQTAPAMPG